MCTLPMEMVTLIFTFADTRTLMVMSYTSRLLRRMVINGDYIRHTLTIKDNIVARDVTIMELLNRSYVVGKCVKDLIIGNVPPALYLVCDDDYILTRYLNNRRSKCVRGCIIINDNMPITLYKSTNYKRFKYWYDYGNDRIGCSNRLLYLVIKDNYKF